MNRYSDAIEPDLLRFYNIDVCADLGTPRLTWRRLVVLLNHLPRESAYVQAVGGDRLKWGDTEHLLAGVIDQQQVTNYLLTRANFKSNRAAPKPIRRPGDTLERDRSNGSTLGNRKYTETEMRRILDSWSDPPEVSNGRS